MNENNLIVMFPLFYQPLEEANIFSVYACTLFTVINEIVVTYQNFNLCDLNLVISIF